MSEEEKHLVVNEINSQIALGVKVMLVAIVPMALAGLGLLVSNHFCQQQLKAQVTEMSQDMKLTNERVTIMWMLGGYSERYESFRKQTNETR